MQQSSQKRSIWLVGIAITNHNGEFVAAAVASAEARAANWRLEIAGDAACIPLIGESDCQEVMNLITGKKSSKMEIVWTISEAFKLRIYNAIYIST